MAPRPPVMNPAESEQSTRYYVVLPTFHRVESLGATLQTILTQTQPPAGVIVVDNGSSFQCKRLCAALDGTASPVIYVDAGENRGSAGGTALGMQVALEIASDSDWIVRCDDDSPPIQEDHIVLLITRLLTIRESDPSAAALGTAGSVFDPHACRLKKPGRASDGEIVEVDYLATGTYPVFSVAAVRDVGVFREDFFFGLDELEYGLRLRSRGYRLYRLDQAHHRRTPSSWTYRLSEPDWRRYYSLRNLLTIALQYCGLGTAVWVAVTRGFLKPLGSLVMSPRLASRHLSINARAVFDAFAKNMGRRIDPVLIDGELQKRSSP